MGIFDIKPWRKRSSNPEFPEPLEVGDPRPVALEEHTHMAAPASTLAHKETALPSPAPEALTTPVSEKTLNDRVVDQIRLVYDPEIPVNIYEMGLIYEVLLADDVATIRMTLTSPQCPAAQEIPVEVKARVEELEEISEAQVDIVWEPPWEPSKMSEMARLELGMY